MDRVIPLDLSRLTVRELNHFLHHELPNSGAVRVEILNPNGMHSIAVGLDTPVEIDIRGHAGYFIAGMNKQANVTVHGNVGWSVAENIMSGTVRVKGCASECAGASGHGGLLVIDEDASSRCGISMKGVDVVVRGSVGHMSAFMAQKGRLLVCGDAGDALGDSIYEARLYVNGAVAGLGADCVEKEVRDEHAAEVRELLERAGIDDVDPAGFRRYGSARALYNFKVDDAGEF